jgi:hypothetical protein
MSSTHTDRTSQLRALPSIGSSVLSSRAQLSLVSSRALHAAGRARRGAGHAVFANANAYEGNAFVDVRWCLALADSPTSHIQDTTDKRTPAITMVKLRPPGDCASGVG